MYEPSLGVDRDVVRIVEPERIGALGPDPAAPGLQELAVLREPDQPIVAAARPVHVFAVRSDLRPAVAVGDPDVAVLGDHHAGRPVEVLLVGAGDARLPEAHQDLAVRTELPDLVAHALLEACFAAAIAGRRAVGDPHVAFPVDEESVRKIDQPLAEAGDDLPVRVHLDNRIEVRLGAAVRAAAIEDPHVPAVAVHLDPARDADLAAERLVPVGIDPVRMAGRLTLQSCVESETCGNDAGCDRGRHEVSHDQPSFFQWRWGPTPSAFLR